MFLSACVKMCENFQDVRKIEVVKDSQRVSERLIEILVSAAESVIAEKNAFTVGLSGKLFSFILLGKFSLWLVKWRSAPIRCVNFLFYDLSVGWDIFFFFFCRFSFPLMHFVWLKCQWYLNMLRFFFFFFFWLSVVNFLCWLSCIVARVCSYGL